ncbi:MAG: nucleotidyltransferase domain-containing protein [Mangrovibacterium sp.]
MRLSQFEINTINTLAQKHFGNGTRVFLFGSRIDDNKKGGDIDLFIKSREDTLTIRRRISFLAELKSIIGDQKIDVVFDNANTRLKTRFYHSISHRNIEL